MHWLNPAAVEFSRSAAALLLAPVIYFFAGLPWAVAARRMAWAPLFGAAAFGLTGELAYMLGAPVSSAVVIVGLLHFVAGGSMLARTRVATVHRPASSVIVIPFAAVFGDSRFTTESRRISYPD